MPPNVPDSRVPEEFVRALSPAMWRAASVARSLEGRVENQPKAGEATEVKAALTHADTAVQEILLATLHQSFPGVTLEAEEDTRSVGLFRAGGESLVVIDPIDGTLRFYLEGGGPYAVMIGLAVDGEYVAGLVALPREDLCFDATRGHGARVAIAQGPARPIDWRAPSGNRVLVSHDLPSAAVDRLQEYGYEVCPASGGAISVAPLVPGVRAGLRLARQNPEGVSVRGRIGAMIAREAGLSVRGISGPFPTSIREPAQALLVTADPRDLRNLAEAIRLV